MSTKTTINPADFTLYISDGMSLNGGGETTLKADDLSDAVRQWREWASAGYYPVNGEVEVCGSIWQGDECLEHVSVTVTGCGSDY